MTWLPELTWLRLLYFERELVKGMLVVETVARIRREFFVKGKSIKEIVRSFGAPFLRSRLRGHRFGRKLISR